MVLPKYKNQHRGQQDSSVGKFAAKPFDLSSIHGTRVVQGDNNPFPLVAL